MTHLFKKLAAASVAAAALTLPVTASAGEYRKCKDTEAAIAGGLIGGSLGTVIGEEVAGRNDKTEGAIAGAIIGGVIGAAIGDGASDCEKDGRVYRHNSHTGSYPLAGARVTTARHPHRNYRTYRHYDRRGNNYRNNRGYGRQDYRSIERQLNQIDRRIDRLRAERSDLKNRRRYDRNRRWTDRRLSEIAYELDRLKDERKYLRKVRKSYRR